MSGPFINLASFISKTESLGPGQRAVIWVQGCPFRCAGCIVPEWQKDIPNQKVAVETLAGWILESPGISGLTISGGEPLLQAKALVQLIRLVRQQRNLDVISYTGYTFGQLLNRIPLFPEIGEYLDSIDVLIDGLYIRSMDDNRGLRGSSNQRIHFLTPRLASFDFENTPRRVDFFIQNHELTLAGIPPHGLLEIFSEISQKSALPDILSRSQV